MGKREFDEIGIAVGRIPVSTPALFVPPDVAGVDIQQKTVPFVIGPNQGLDPPPEAVDETFYRDALDLTLLPKLLIDAQFLPS